MTDQPSQTRFAKDQLKAFVERIERLLEEGKTIADDVRDVYAEAKGTGFDVKALRAVIRLRRQDPQERTEHELILDTYLSSLGMLPLDESQSRTLNRSGNGGSTPPPPAKSSPPTPTASSASQGSACLAETGGPNPTTSDTALPFIPSATDWAPSFLVRGHPDCAVREARH